MSIIDIRKTEAEKPNTIRFADVSRSGNRQADVIAKGEHCIKIYESGNGDYVRVWTAEDARNMIKALEKAIELGMLV